MILDNFELAKKYFLEGINDLERGLFQEAEGNFLESLRLIPDRASTLTNLSAAQIHLKKYSEASASLEKAISIGGENCETYLNLGLLEKERENYLPAINYFNQSLLLNPSHVAAQLNKGAILNEIKDFDEALVAYGKALSIKPDYAEAWSNKGVTLNELKRFDEALVAYEKALSIKPDIDWILGSFLHAKMTICSWSNFDEILDSLIVSIHSNNKASNPFSLLALTDDALLHKKCAEIYTDRKYPFKPILGAIPLSINPGKVRIGYFSADFHSHATGYLMAELFELHDKSIFEVYAFSFGPKQNDQMRQRLINSFDRFIEVGNLSEIEIAKLSRELLIDIAVDLKGFTKDSRPGIFSYRAAPIQVSYLGYPGSTGAKYIDYIIGDKTLIPAGSEIYYSEEVAFLPASYQANDRNRIIANSTYTKEDFGLPENGFIFCCFNNNYKILPSTFNGWMRILEAVKGSVLWLLEDNPLAAENLKNEARNRDIDPNRLVFAKRMQLPDHLARHYLADLFIDTFPYNAHTTSSDALWMGVPVLTLSGKSFASRVASSLLHALDLTELVTKSQNEYEAKAISLALNPGNLLAIKQKLIQHRDTSPLFDTLLFAKGIEDVYLKMLSRLKSESRLDLTHPQNES